MTRVLAGALAALALMTTAEAGPSRADALAALTATDVEARRIGAAGLLDAGTMSDAPALVGALRDSDAQVRQLAEAALWAVWRKPNRWPARRCAFGKRRWAPTTSGPGTPS